MNCTQFQDQLDDFLDGAVSGLPAASAEKHLEHCPNCRRLVDAEQTMRDTLRNLPVEPASPGFPARALSRARRGNSRPGRAAFAAGFSSAAAIAVVIWAVAGQPTGYVPAPEPAEVRLALAEERQVNLVFDVPAAMEGAELAMELPAHVELAGYPGRKRLSWRTDLVQGRNVLTLPILGRESADGELVARITYDGKEKQFRVRLKVGAHREADRPGRA